MGTKEKVHAELDAALAQLTSKDVATVRAGAKKLEARSADNWTKDKQEWLTRASSIEAMVSVLGASADEKVRTHLIGALGFTSRRYKCDDPRILPALLARAGDGSDQELLALALALAPFGTDAAWDVVARALDARPPKDAHDLVGRAVSKFGEGMSAAARGKLLPKLHAAARKEKNPGARHALIAAVGRIGSTADLPFLRELEAVDAASPILAEAIQMAIAEVSARPPA